MYSAMIFSVVLVRSRLMRSLRRDMTVVVILPMRGNIEKYEGNQMLRLYL